MAVIAGAGVGGLARYALSLLIQQRVGPGFPVATLVINITGSFLLGFLMRFSLQSGVMGPELRALFTTGFCGGYTTFSTFSYETALLMEDGEYGRASLYIGSSVVGALFGTFLGFAAANALLGWRTRA